MAKVASLLEPNAGRFDLRDYTSAYSALQRHQVPFLTGLLPMLAPSYLLGLGYYPCLIIASTQLLTEVFPPPLQATTSLTTRLAAAVVLPAAHTKLPARLWGSFSTRVASWLQVYAVSRPGLWFYLPVLPLSALIADAVTEWVDDALFRNKTDKDTDKSWLQLVVSRTLSNTFIVAITYPFLVLSISSYFHSSATPASGKKLGGSLLH